MYRNFKQKILITKKVFLYGFYWSLAYLIFLLFKLYRYLKSLFIDHRKNNKILILCNGRIGDVVLQIPAVKVLVEYFKGAEIIMAIDEKYNNIIHLPIDRNNVSLFPYRTGEGFQKIINIFLLFHSLKGIDFSLIISLNNTLWSAFIAFLIDADIRIGINTQHSGFLLTSPLVDRRDLHEVERNLSVVSALGISVNNIQFKKTFCIKRKDIEYIDNFLAQNGVKKFDKVIALNPMSRQGYFWPVVNWAQIIKQLTNYNYKLILIGDKNSSEIMNDINNYLEIRPISAVGKTTLSELGALLARCNLFITVDSGPMHIASACGTSVVGIFGPTDYRRWGPFWGNHIVVRKELPCSPCAPYPCNKRECLETITVEEVIEAVEFLIGS
jgi:lipopolysaccharide heptosyltransferase II